RQNRRRPPQAHLVSNPPLADELAGTLGTVPRVPRKTTETLLADALVSDVEVGVAGEGGEGVAEDFAEEGDVNNARRVSLKPRVCYGVACASGCDRGERVPDVVERRTAVTILSGS